MNNQLDIVKYQRYVIGLTKLTFDYYNGASSTQSRFVLHEM